MTDDPSGVGENPKLGGGRLPERGKDTELSPAADRHELDDRREEMRPLKKDKHATAQEFETARQCVCGSREGAASIYHSAPLD